MKTNGIIFTEKEIETIEFLAVLKENDMKTHAQLKKDLDKVFSQYVRWVNADDNGLVECYTCYVKKPVKEMQNGHFISRRSTSTRWLYNADMVNCKPQCVACNMYRQGEQLKFYRRLVSEYGEDKVEEVIQLSKRTEKVTKGDLIYLIDMYKEELKNLIS